jgi:hypothetical protein
MSTVAPETDIVVEATRLLEAARANDVPVRLIGGLAVRLHIGAESEPVFTREYKDIDLATLKGKSKQVTELMLLMGYEADRPFNATNGHRRLLFYDMANQRQVDVFVGSFEMCHEIPITERILLAENGIPLAELLLTKLQIVQLNPKDMRDAWAVLLFHDVGDHDDETVNADVVARRLAADWGLWRTTRGNVERLREELAGSGLGDLERAAIDDRLLRLWERVEREPKSLRWRSRAKLGDRTRWYQEPEEVQRAPAG